MRQRFLMNTREVLDKWRPSRIFLRRARPRAAILAYHRVGESVLDTYGQAVSPGNFACHIRHLQRHYHVTSLGELLEQLPSGTYPDGTVAVTFDDGYADNLTTAYPIAEQYNAPLTVFVTVQPMLQGKAFWWDELALCVLQKPVTGSARLFINSDKPYIFSMESDAERRSSCERLHSILKLLKGRERDMAVEQVRSWVMPSCGQPDIGRPLTPTQLQKLAGLPGISIGAHTMTHPILRALPVEEQEQEMTSSKKKLEQLLCRPVTMMAYPFGKSTDISRKTCRLAERVGYRAAFTTIAKPVVPSIWRYALPRLTIHDWPEETFAQRLNSLFRYYE